MYRLTNIDTGSSCTLSDGDLSTIDNALVNVAADCRHFADQSRGIGTQSEAFLESAQKYERVRQRLTDFIDEMPTVQQRTSDPPRCETWLQSSAYMDGVARRCCLRLGHSGDHVAEMPR